MIYGIVIDSKSEIQNCITLLWIDNAAWMNAIKSTILYIEKHTNEDLVEFMSMKNSSVLAKL